jgi:hypothetical protein
MPSTLNSLFTTIKAPDPDKMANISMIMGISAFLFMLFPSYTLILEIPSGVLAIHYGRRSMKKKTGKKIKAFFGQVLGLIVLISLAIEIFLAVLVIIARQFWE